MRNALILTLSLALANAVFCQTDTLPKAKAPLAMFQVQAGGLTEPGFCPISFGMLFGFKKMPVFNFNRFYFLEGGLIRGHGIYLGNNLSLGQKIDFGSFMIYFMAGYGMNSIRIRDYKNHGNFLIHGYTADIGVRVPFGQRPGLGINCEFGYAQNRPLNLKLGLTF